MTELSRAVLGEQLTSYIEENFLGGSEASRIQPDTPLLEWGVLNSMNTAMLLSHIRNHLGVTVPPAYITGRHFKNVASIADLVYELSPQHS
jgi:acyl carrier protein